jgi:hypothetical protein
MFNVTKEPNDTHIKILKEILGDIAEKFMEKVLDMLNQMYSRNVKTPKIKNMRRNRTK